MVEPLCTDLMLSLDQSSSAEMEWKGIQCPGLGSGKTSIANVLSLSWLEGPVSTLCLWSETGWWDGACGEVGCKSSPERSCKVYHFWVTYEQIHIWSHGATILVSLLHPRLSNPCTGSSHHAVGEGNSRPTWQHPSSQEAELGSHLKIQPCYYYKNRWNKMNP